MVGFLRHAGCVASPVPVVKAFPVRFNGCMARAGRRRCVCVWGGGGGGEEGRR